MNTELDPSDNVPSEELVTKIVDGAYSDVRESVELAMRAENIDEETVEQVLERVDNAVGVGSDRT